MSFFYDARRGLHSFKIQLQFGLQLIIFSLSKTIFTFYLHTTLGFNAVLPNKTAQHACRDS